MALNPRLLRRLFAGGAVLTVLVVCASIFGNAEGEQNVRDIPKNIAANLAQAHGVHIFQVRRRTHSLTIHAAQARQLRMTAAPNSTT